MDIFQLIRMNSSKLLKQSDGNQFCPTVVNIFLARLSSFWTFGVLSAREVDSLVGTISSEPVVHNIHVDLSTVTIDKRNIHLCPGKRYLDFNMKRTVCKEYGILWLVLNILQSHGIHLLLPPVPELLVLVQFRSAGSTDNRVNIACHDHQWGRYVVVQRVENRTFQN